MESVGGLAKLSETACSSAGDCPCRHSWRLFVITCLAAAQCEHPGGRLHPALINAGQDSEAHIQGDQEGRASAENHSRRHVDEHRDHGDPQLRQRRSGRRYRHKGRLLGGSGGWWASGGRRCRSGGAEQPWYLTPECRSGQPSRRGPHRRRRCAHRRVPPADRLQRRCGHHQDLWPLHRGCSLGRSQAGLGVSRPDAALRLPFSEGPQPCR